MGIPYKHQEAISCETASMSKPYLLGTGARYSTISIILNGTLIMDS